MKINDIVKEMHKFSGNNCGQWPMVFYISEDDAESRDLVESFPFATTELNDRELVEKGLFIMGIPIKIGNVL